MWYNVFSLVFALGGLAVAYWLYQELFKQQPVNSKMQVIATAIKEGANAFLRRQYRTIGYLAIVAMFLIYLVYAGIGEWRYGLQAASAFLLGAVFSSLAGIAGMYLSVRVNLLTAESAENSFAKALKIALRGGAVSGILVVSLSLLGISSLVWFYNSVMGYDLTLIPGIIIGFGFGASFVALFAQLGGGIFTKAADMGADLVGKVETGIPEDDARNPAVIADLVGDNVGDCAGRGADLFESTAAENIGAMILGVALYPVFGIKGIMFPLVIRALGLLASIIGIMSVRAKEEESPMKALNRGYYVTAILSVIFLAIATKYMLDNWYFFWAGVVGVVTSIFFVFVTQYYTEYRFRPVRSIAKASETGPATNIVTGLAVGMESTALPVMGIVFALLGAYKLGVMSGVEGGGLYGTAVATMGMLASCAYILAMDNFGPIVDNAGGIAEMSGADESTRVKTDKLDAAGNTTKALTKGYAMGSAALAAFLLFSAYLEAAGLKVVDLTNLKVFLGGMIGAMIVFLFSGLTIRAVGQAAYGIINEVRRQFKADPGILAGTSKPDYGVAVDIATKGALKEMILPGALVILAPIVVGLWLRAEAVAAFLMISTITGIILALMMNNSGGAWDNAKKFIESGLFKDSNDQVQGKRSLTHAAAVVGDTVGDPFKDTAGPSLHVLVKLLSTLTLVLASLFI